MQKAMTKRAGDRRNSRRQFYDPICDQRRPGYDRRGQVATAPSPGAVRPGFGEAPPPVERRKVPDSGMELEGIWQCF